jgi:hypothetical protein
MSEKINVASFQIGPDPKKDVVRVEEMLMRLAMAQAVFEQQREYIELIEANDGQVPGDMLPPDSWAVTGAHTALMYVSHALKCGCWGHEAACIH